MKIFSSTQLYEADNITTKNQNISSVDLMERAAQQIFNWLHLRMQGAQVPIHIFCGIGNNGGDGLALGRFLINNGYNVNIYIANFTDKRSKCFLINYDRVKQITKKWPILMRSENDFPSIHPDDIIVDCLFGIGLNRPPEGWVKQLIQYLNLQKAFKLSVDIPSGLSSEGPLLDQDAVIQANHTLTFQTPKLAFFLPESGQFVPFFEVLNIGLDAQYLQETKPIAQLIYKPNAQLLYKQRKKYTSKVNYGHTLTIGGSLGKIGAIVLATKAAITSGSGWVTSFVPRGGNNILQISVPEAMTIYSTQDNYIENFHFTIKPTAIAIGMGLGQLNETKMAFIDFLKKVKCPLVLDADALQILATMPEHFNLLPKETILTPHEGELLKLIGKWDNDFDKIEKAKQFSTKFGVIVVIKGAHTLTIFNDQLFVNTTGNPGMATAGSGDVLSGIIAGLCAQGYSPLEASLFGVYMHGSAGNLASQTLGFEALTASKIIDYLGPAFIALFQEPQNVNSQENQEDQDEDD